MLDLFGDLIPEKKQFVDDKILLNEMQNESKVIMRILDDYQDLVKEKVTLKDVEQKQYFKLQLKEVKIIDYDMFPLKFKFDGYVRKFFKSDALLKDKSIKKFINLLKEEMQTTPSVLFIENFLWFVLGLKLDTIYNDEETRNACLMQQSKNMKLQYAQFITNSNVINEKIITLFLLSVVYINFSIIKKCFPDDCKMLSQVFFVECCNILYHQIDGQWMSQSSLSKNLQQYFDLNFLNFDQTDHTLMKQIKEIKKLQTRYRNQMFNIDNTTYSNDTQNFMQEMNKRVHGNVNEKSENQIIKYLNNSKENNIETQFLKLYKKIFEVKVNKLSIKYNLCKISPAISEKIQNSTQTLHQSISLPRFFKKKNKEFEYKEISLSSYVEPKNISLKCQKEIKPSFQSIDQKKISQLDKSEIQKMKNLIEMNKNEEKYTQNINILPSAQKLKQQKQQPYMLSLQTNEENHVNNKTDDLSQNQTFDNNIKPLDLKQHFCLKNYDNQKIIKLDNKNLSEQMPSLHQLHLEKSYENKRQIYFSKYKFLQEDADKSISHLISKFLVKKTKTQKIVQFAEEQLKQFK